MTKIHKPAAWESVSLDELMGCEAGQAYVLAQFCRDNPIEPEYRFFSSRTGHDTAAYKVYDDGSLWFAGNAEDEVWADFRDFVTATLLPGIAAANAAGNMHWTDDEAARSDDPAAFAINSMDRNLLLLFCEGDDAEAREIAGIECVA